MYGTRLHCTLYINRELLYETTYVPTDCEGGRDVASAPVTIGNVIAGRSQSQSGRIPGAVDDFAEIRVDCIDLVNNFVLASC